MLLATVDKFAQMPWKGEVETLFGRVDGLCKRHGFLSPDDKDSGDTQPAAGNDADEPADEPSPAGGKAKGAGASKKPTGTAGGKALKFKTYDDEPYFVNNTFEPDAA